MTTALRISAADNVATALEALAPGATVQIDEIAVAVTETIPRGHKVALREIRAGDVVIKYGSSIGIASSDIAAGAHVHVHNVASSRGRGDTAHSRPSSPGGRLAEPDADA